MSCSSSIHKLRCNSNLNLSLINLNLKKKKERKKIEKGANDSNLIWWRFANQIGVTWLLLPD